MALLINQAFRTGDARFEGYGTARDAVQGGTSAGRYISVGGCDRQIENGTTALVKMRAGYKNEYLSNGDALSAAFELALHPRGVALGPTRG